MEFRDSVIVPIYKEKGDIGAYGVVVITGGKANITKGAYCVGFKSHCGKLFASELLQFRLPRFASVFRRRH